MKTGIRLLLAVFTGLATLLSNAAAFGQDITVVNHSFEADTFTVFPGYVQGNGGVITGWNAPAGSGINPGGGSPFANNGTIPDGSQVLFIQNNLRVTQVLSNFVVGETYYVEYHENARGGQNPIVHVEVGGEVVVPSHSAPSVGGSNPYRLVRSRSFTATNETLELAFVKTGPGGDHTVLIDNVKVLAVPANTTPEILSHPANQLVGIGDTVTLSVEAFGSMPFTFQWRGPNGDLLNETNQSLVLTNVQLNQQGAYSVMVSNGGGSAVSSNATLTVRVRVPGLFNTGVDNEGNLLPDGAIDPHYTIVTNPDSTNTEAFVHFTDVFPISTGHWLGATDFSKWIAPRTNTGVASGTNTEQAAVGDYVYRTEFDLTGIDLPSLEITGGWATDNVGMNIRVNGRDTGIVNNNQFGSLTSFLISQANTNVVFVDGINTLEFVVNNGAPPGPTALRVEGLRGLAAPPGTPPSITVQPQDVTLHSGETLTLTVTATGSAPLRYQWRKGGEVIADATNATYTSATPVTMDAAGQYNVTVANDVTSVASSNVTVTVLSRIPGAFNTGVDDNGNALAAGSVDTHYQIVINPDSTTSTEAIVHNEGFPIAPAGPWLANSANSKWIAPRADTTAAAGGVYTYRLTLDLTDRDTSTVLINGNWSSDNTGVRIVVNGTATTNSHDGNFGVYHPFRISSSDVLFRNGPNTIDFVVDNLAAGYTGLRVANLLTDARDLPAGTAPQINMQPVGGEIRQTGNLLLTANAIGSGQLFYQWFLNGFELIDETNATLNISNGQADQGGEYTVRVTSDFGETTSTPAVITIAPTLELEIDKMQALRVQGRVGRTYLIESAPAGSSEFTTFTNVVVESSPQIVFFDNPDDATRSFRISEVTEVGVAQVRNFQNLGETLHITTNATYLHKLDFPADGSGALVNGVQFSAVGATADGTDPLTGNFYSLTMNNPLNFAGDGLLGDFIHNGGQQAGSVATLGLGGFTAGNYYDVRLYYRNFGGRPNTVTVDLDGVEPAEYTNVLDQATSSDRNFWSIKFRAAGTNVTIRFSQDTFNASWHHYAVTSEEIGVEMTEPGVEVADLAVVTVNGIPGRQVVIERKSDLNPAVAWEQWLSFTLMGESMTFIDPTTGPGVTRFYRATSSVP